MPKLKFDTSSSSRVTFFNDAIEFGQVEANKNLAMGWAGSNMAQASYYDGTTNTLDRNDGYLIDQGPVDSQSALCIGPLRYTYSVQDISIFEERAIEAPESTRSDRPVLIDSGKPYQKAIVRLLFNGIEEINSHLRPLVALFRVCPIISISNELLSKTWSPKTPTLLDNVNVQFNNLQAAKVDEPFKQGRRITYNDVRTPAVEENANLKKDISDIITGAVLQLNSEDYVPVCMESIAIETVPEVPNTISLTLTLVHIDVASISEHGQLQYLGPDPGTFDTDPKKAYWLKKWLKTVLDGDVSGFPTISEESFGAVEFKFFDKAISKVNDLAGTPASIVFNREEDYTKVIGLSATIAHRFAYHRLLGRALPCAQHMGISSRSLSMAIDFSDKDDLLERFSEFKETSDKFLRAETILDRVMGWEIINPLTKLLGSHINTQYVEELNGVFAPLTVSFSTTDQPGVKACSLTCLESNVNFLNTNQILLDSGGVDFDNLKELLELIVDKDYVRRTTPNINLKDHAVEIAAHNALFPRDNNGLEGILNRDTIRAIFLSPKLDRAQDFKAKLLKLPLATGKVISSDLKANFLESFWKGLTKIGIGSPNSLSELDLETITYSIVSDLIDTAVPAEFFREISANMVLAMFGDPRLATDAINKLKGSNVKFSQKFKDALYDVVVNRLPAPPILSKVYDKEGLYLAFNILYLDYIDSKALYPGFDNESLYSPINSSVWRQSNYLDFRMPTYRALFGEKWQHFAPTYDDLGISYWQDRGTSMPANSSPNRQTVLACKSTDKVPPFIWFYSKRIKTDMRAGLKITSQGYLQLANRRYLSMNLRSVHQANRLRSLGKSDEAELEKIAKGDLVDPTNKTTRTLVEMITQAYTDSTGRFNMQGFSEDLAATEDMFNTGETKERIEPDGSRTRHHRLFYEKFLAPESPHKINLYFTTTGIDQASPGGYISSRFQVSPIAGAAYIKVMHSEKFTIKKNLSPLDIHPPTSPLTDKPFTTVGAGSIDNQRRNLASHTIETIESSLSQIPDDSHSACKLFPAAKVFFLERRGNDLVADDVYYSTDAILSIDVTLDKDDAGLAVIKIADPLRFTQNSSFGSSNITTGKVKADGEEYSSVVMANKRKVAEGVIKQRKIEQGRAIQIRIGYSSNIDHLPIIFTGRITEVELGDHLTIVAQDWKAELINRQVNFYSNNTKSWGAKDLVVQAIQLSDPDGIGEHFPERQARALISRLKSTQEGVIRNSSNQQKDANLTKDAPSIFTDLSRLIGLNSLEVYDPDARKPGLDTRLKNIWYPDMSTTINNFFKWRRIFGQHGPDFINDYWLIPLQPAWSAIKEAARHTWNYVAQVVPYDGEATLFFGHPDQMYYYTRGRKNKLDEWKKFSSQAVDSLGDRVSRLMVDFKVFEANRSGQLFPAGFFPIQTADPFILFKTYHNVPNKNRFQNSNQEIAANKGKPFSIYQNYIAYLAKNAGGETPANQVIDKIIENIKSSGLPYSRLDEINTIMGGESIPILLYMFYGIRPDRLHLWPSYERAIEALLKSQKTSGQANAYAELISTVTLVGDLQDDTSQAIPARSEDIQVVLKLVENTIKRMKLNDNSSVLDIRNMRRLLKLQDLFSSSALIGAFDDLEKALKPDLIEVSVQAQDSGLGTVSSGKFVIVDRRLALTQLNLIRDILKNQIDVKLTGNKVPTIYPTDGNLTIKELFDQSDYLFKAFVYFFAQFLQEIQPKEKVEALAQEAKNSSNHPNMKTFRVHHYVDSNRDILENNIVASTAEMWNTVVISRPAENPADTTIADNSPMQVGTQVKTSVNWVYWPRPIISKVIGLQFHPGITLANKKVKLFTELNCISDELSAKLACNNLADGIRKMYRGTILIRGRNIKPYDRVILNDTYTGMKGPFEVESVIHHFSASKGWVCNIVPEAVCDANPGAAIIQTAIMEANFERWMNVAGVAYNALLLGTVLAAPGVGTALKAVMTRTVPTLLNTTLKSAWITGGRMLATSARKVAEIGYNPLALGGYFEKYYPTVTRLLGAYLLNGAIKDIAQHSLNFAAMTSWIDGASDKDAIDQLPVILSPLMYNGTPWTAGLEADDILFSIPFYDTYYALHDLKVAFKDYLGVLDR
jgi:hypothetical protein